MPTMTEAEVSAGTSSTSTRSRDTYSAERDRSGERSYFADLFRSEVLHDVGASQRIAAHRGEARALTTGGLAGLVPPTYLIEQAALVARAGRPFANSVTQLPIPDSGMSLIVPKGTTGAAVASQATENTAVQNTDEVWTNVTLPVATIAGQAQVSRQSLERGAPGIDALIYADLAGAYAAELDRQVVTGSGSSGQMLGVLNTAGVAQASAFTAAATIAAFYTKVAGMISTISTARGLPPDTIAMHPRRYAWLLAQVDSQNRPLVTPAPEQGPMNTMGVTGATPAYGTGAGTFLGLNIVVDINMPTSIGTGPEDQVIVYRAADHPARAFCLSLRQEKRTPPVRSPSGGFPFVGLSEDQLSGLPNGLGQGQCLPRVQVADDLGVDLHERGLGEVGAPVGVRHAVQADLPPVTLKLSRVNHRPL